MGVAIIWILIIAATLYLAHQKGRNMVAWFFLSLLFGVIALAVLVFLQPLKRCPVCGKTVASDARVCPYCRHSFYENDSFSNRKQVIDV